MLRMWVGAFSAFFWSCGVGTDMLAHTGVCDHYPESATSPYIYPFAVGRAVTVSQGNCQAMTHKGFLQFSYDFDVPTGTPIHASRSGTVVERGEGGIGGCNGHYVYLKHQDGSIARYLHLKEGSILVNQDAAVTQGAQIAESANTGCTGGFPHLHFDIIRDPNKIKTGAITFRNVGANPRGLEHMKSYTGSAFTVDQF